MSADIRSTLWEFAYGLLEESEQSRVISQIQSNPSIAREYVRTMQEIALLREVSRGGPGETLDWHMDDDHTHVVFPDPLPRKLGLGRSQLVGRRVFSVLATLLVLWLLWSMCSEYWSADSSVRSQAVQGVWNAYSDHFPRMLVTGPAELRLGVTASYQVILQRSDGAPAVTRVKAELRDAEDHLLWRSSRPTTVSGTARFDIPPVHKSGYYRLEFDTPEIAPVFPLTERTQQVPFVTWLPARVSSEIKWTSTYPVRRGENTFQVQRSVLLSRLWTENEIGLGVSPYDALNALPIVASLSLSSEQSGIAEEQQEQVPQPDATTSVPLPNKEVMRQDKQQDSTKPSNPRQRTLPANRWLVEELHFDHGRVMNRFILPSVLEQGALTGSNSSDEASSESQRHAWFDYSTVPPLFKQLEPVALQPLPLHNIQITADIIDQNSQAEFITTRIATRNAGGQPIPSVLAIAVETGDGAMEPQQLRALQQALRKADVREQLELNLPPLVFDNRATQIHHLETAFEAWRAKRDSRRQFAALQLLIASSAGYVLILCASLLKYLPRMIYWMPAMLVMGMGFAFGTLWLTLTDPPSPVTESLALASYGVRSEKPDEEEFQSLTDKISQHSSAVEIESIERRSEATVEIPTMVQWQSLLATQWASIKEAGTSTSTWNLTREHWVNNAWKQAWQAISNKNVSSEQAPPKAEGIQAWHPFVETDADGTVTIAFSKHLLVSPLRLKIEAVGYQSIGTHSISIPAQTAD